MGAPGSREPKRGARTGTLNLYRLQICVRGRVPEGSQHRDDLAFVMKCVSDDMQQDKGRTPEFAAPVHWALCQRRVKLLLVEIAQIGSCRLSYSVFGSSQGRHCWVIFFAPAGEGLVLQIVHPAFLTRQDVHKLLPN